MSEFHGKAILVTGGGSGIGLATAARLSTGDLDRLVETIGDRFGRLDGVVANAGVGMLDRAADATEAAFGAVPPPPAG
jgi:NAD(P)-dependent dehydrogenase (short-subunit alcohol dehydrogenase family)